MARDTDKTKAKWIILTFLICNRGKKFTSKQLQDFIVENNLYRSSSELNKVAISRMIASDKKFGTILRDVQVEKVGGRNYYWVDA